MQVTSERSRGHGKFLVVEVPARGETDVPVLGNLQVTREVEVVRQLVGIAHSLLTDGSRGILAHGHAIAHAEVPGQGKLDIAILVESPLITLATALLGLGTVGIDILHGRIHLILLLVVLLVLTLSLGLLAEEFAESVVVEGIGEVLGHTLETSEASLRPLRMVGDIDTSVLILLIGVCSKDRVHGEGITLGELHADTHVEVRPGTALGRHVVAQAGSQFIKQTDFLVARSVLGGAHLHLHVVAQVHGDASRLALAHGTIGRPGKGRVRHGGDIAVLVRLDIAVIVAETRCTEVGRIAEADGGRHDMAHHHPLLLLAVLVGQDELVGAIEFGVGGNREAVVIDIVEAEHRVAHSHLAVSIPRLLHLVTVHTVGEVERRRDVQVVEERERGTDGHLMTHTVAPVLDETLLEELVLLGRKAVGQRTRVAHGNLFVPALGSHGLLALEGVETLEADIECGQGNRERTVAHVLGQVESTRKRKSDAAERLGVTDTARTRTLRVALGIVHRGEVVALITAGGKVHTGREGLRGIGLGILAVAPGQLETLAHAVVGHVFFSLLGILVTEQ